MTGRRFGVEWKQFQNPGSSLEKLASSRWRTAKEVGKPFFCPRELQSFLTKCRKLLSKPEMCETW